MANHSTDSRPNTAPLWGTKIQSILTKLLEHGEYALMSSKDLSAAFNVINVDLLIKRLNIQGLPNYIVKLIEICKIKDSIVLAKIPEILMYIFVLLELSKGQYCAQYYTPCLSHRYLTWPK